jgi:hypothetical protein
LRRHIDYLLLLNFFGIDSIFKIESIKITKFLAHILIIPTTIPIGTIRRMDLNKIIEDEAHYNTMKKLISMLKRIKHKIPKDILKNHRHYISDSPHFTIRNFEEKKWGLSLGPVTKNVLTKFNYTYIILNKNIPIEFIQNHPEIPWCRESLSRRLKLEESKRRGITKGTNRDETPIITFEELMAMNDDFEDVQGTDRWMDTWMNYCSSPQLDIQRVIDNPSPHWDWDTISSNSVVTIDFVKNNMELPWKWDSISYNSKLTIEFVENNSEFPWDWVGVMGNNFTPDYEKELDKIKKKKRYNMIYSRFATRCESGIGM